MFFLVRVAFWIMVVLALLPAGSTLPQAKGPQIGATDAVVAAGAAVSDVSHFCERQADACEVGSQAAVAIGNRAQAGARMVFDFINHRLANSTTGSITQTTADPESQHTLRPADMTPAWRGPAQPKHTGPHPTSPQREVVLPRPDPRKASRRPA